MIVWKEGDTEKEHVIRLIHLASLIQAAVRVPLFLITAVPYAQTLVRNANANKENSLVSISKGEGLF